MTGAIGLMEHSTAEIVYVTFHLAVRFTEASTNRSMAARASRTLTGHFDARFQDAAIGRLSHVLSEHICLPRTELTVEETRRCLPMISIVA
jgi:hypothetical protein